jgi:hypothetical protein
MPASETSAPAAPKQPAVEVPVRFEQDLSVPYERTLKDIQRALEVRGIEFQFEGQIGVGLRVNSQKKGASTASFD